jgi:hypothetical protein
LSTIQGNIFNTRDTSKMGIFIFMASPPPLVMVKFGSVRFRQGFR